MGALVAQDFEGKRQKGIAGKNGGCLIEGDMERGAATPDGVVVHGGQVVMHQRVAMHAFERASGGKGVLLLDAKQTRRFDEKKRSQSLAAPKRRIAHGLAEPGSQGGGAQALGEQAVEPSLEGAGDAFGLCEKRHLLENVKNSGPLPQNPGNPYPNTTLLKAATGRYKARSWRFKLSQASAHGSAPRDAIDLRGAGAPRVSCLSLPPL